MKDNDAYADAGTFTVTTECRDDVFALGNTTIGVLVEIWRDEKGNFRRPLYQPAVVVYDLESMEKLYEAWPQPDGSFKGRVIVESPCEVYYTGHDARMVWYDHGEVSGVHNIDPALRDSDTPHGESFNAEFARAVHDRLVREPTPYEKTVPSPLSLILER